MNRDDLKTAIGRVICRTGPHDSEDYTEWAAVLADKITVSVPIIAAAPALLEALMALTASQFVSFHNYEGDNLLERTRAAIAQALGEEALDD